MWKYYNKSVLLPQVDYTVEEFRNHFSNSFSKLDSLG